jgi:hypothetical protein
MKARVQDYPQYYRDGRSGGIIHDNDAEYLEYKKKKMAQKRVSEQKQSLDTRLNNLEKEVEGLKTGINQILELLTNGTKDSATKNG